MKNKSHEIITNITQSCSVAVCVHPKDIKLSFHRFPRDPELRRQWILACHRADSFNPLTARICSLHFLPEHYMRDLRNELLGQPTVARLHKNAVPNQNLFPEEYNKHLAKLREAARNQNKDARDEQNDSDGCMYPEVLFLAEDDDNDDSSRHRIQTSRSKHSSADLKAKSKSAAATKRSKDDKQNLQIVEPQRLENRCAKRTPGYRKSKDIIEPLKPTIQAKPKRGRPKIDLKKNPKKIFANTKTQTDFCQGEQNVDELVEKIRQLEQTVENQKKMIKNLTRNGISLI